ncbi:diguanylate cyclase domain-containing protein [Vibrio sp. YIC-376]|uniref:diguanylate cyclase domain-containing protein n=1 Tax=Vibrio sp. YIC-376 TaxID=3136162 RepID=UPI00402A974C
MNHSYKNRVPALVYLDLDDFNCNYGHDVGAQVLKTFTSQLKINMRILNTVFRQIDLASSHAHSGYHSGEFGICHLGEHIH